MCNTKGREVTSSLTCFSNDSQPEADLRQTTAQESKTVIIFWGPQRRLNLRQFLLFDTGVRRTLYPPLLILYYEVVSLFDGLHGEFIE